jgi:hypothetical protein
MMSLRAAPPRMLPIWSVEVRIDWRERVAARSPRLQRLIPLVVQAVQRDVPPEPHAQQLLAGAAIDDPRQVR